MSEPPAQRLPVTLGIGASLLRAGHLWGLMAFFIGLPLLVLLVLVYLMLALGGERADAGAVTAALWAQIRADRDSLLLLWAAAIVTPLAALFLLAQRLATIRVDHTGLHAHIPRWLGIGVFRQTAGRWHVCWDELRGARLVVPPARRRRPAAQRLGWTRLVLETGHGETWLNPFAWFDRAGPDHRLGLGEVLGRRRVEVLRRLDDAPLLRLLTGRGLTVQREGDED